MHTVVHCSAEYQLMMKKILTFRFCLFVIFLAILVSYIVFRWLDETLDPEELRRQHCSHLEPRPRELTAQLPSWFQHTAINIHHELPLQSFLTSILEWRKRVLPTIISKNLTGIQISKGACEPAFLVGDPLRILFHMPHFGYRFFPFLSYLLWQNDIHGQDRCLKYFVVPNLGTPHDIIVTATCNFIFIL